MKLLLLLAFLTLITVFGGGKAIEINTNDGPYSPTWSSLDSRPLPQWYDDAKIGIFLHWGVFSVPSFSNEWFWSDWKLSEDTKILQFMKTNYPSGFTYQDFAKDFTAELFDPAEWAQLFKISGAKYVVLTSKHHEGYTMWPSQYSFSWNAGDVGPHKDVLGLLAEAVRTEGLTFGLYHSMFEWFNPMYLSDKKSKFESQVFSQNKMLPELIEMINIYEPDILWSDGDWEAPDSYWKSTDFLAWLYNSSPVKDKIVINDRWGSDVRCKHGGFNSCQESFNPGVLQSHKWENLISMDRISWGYRRKAAISDFLTIEELLKSLAMTVSCGGNLIINIGPTKEGTIAPIFQERLTQLGTWLDINGKAVYKTVPWTAQNDTRTSGVWYTSEKSGYNVFAIILEWPSDGLLRLGSVYWLFMDGAVAVILGNEKKQVEVCFLVRSTFRMCNCVSFP